MFLIPSSDVCRANLFDIINQMCFIGINNKKNVTNKVSFAKSERKQNLNKTGTWTTSSKCQGLNSLSALLITKKKSHNELS